MGVPPPRPSLAQQAHQLLLLTNAGARRGERVHGTSGSLWHAATTIVAIASRAEHAGPVTVNRRPSQTLVTSRRASSDQRALAS